MRLKRMDTINVIPFIDIMLVLLVMVLTTATFIKTGLIHVDLPKAEHAPAGQKTQELSITIKKEGSLWLDEHHPITLAQFEQRVQKGGKEMNVVLYADKETKFENFVQVMDVLQHLGHDKLSIVTDHDASNQ